MLYQAVLYRAVIITVIPIAIIQNIPDVTDYMQEHTVSTNFGRLYPNAYNTQEYPKKYTPLGVIYTPPYVFTETKFVRVVKVIIRC